jgi:hypothetical protein
MFAMCVYLLLTVVYCTMKVGNVTCDTSPPGLPPQGRFSPVVNGAPEEVCITPPPVLGNVRWVSLRRRSNKLVSYEDIFASADEGNDTGSDCLSPPSLNRLTDNMVEVRAKAVSNSALRMKLRRLADKLAASNIDLDPAHEQHGSATNMIISLKQDLRAYEDMADELKFTSGALVNAKDELVCARIEIEKNETI